MKKTLIMIAMLCCGCIQIGMLTAAAVVESDKPELGQRVCKTKEGYVSCSETTGFHWFDPNDESKHRCSTKGAERGFRCIADGNEGIVK